MSEKRSLPLTVPARAGYRWPAEWERHRATWLVWPHNRETWPDRLEAVERVYCQIVAALADGEFLEIVVPSEADALRVTTLVEGVGVPSSRVACHVLASDDSWVRDTGPVFLVDGSGSLGAADFQFDSWGGKYPPWDRDDALACELAGLAFARHFRADFVLEGGAIDGDGAGTLLTTESCLLASRPEPGRSREKMERRLSDWLGASRVIWLSGEISGDDTDGHIDDLARFVAPGVVVAAAEVRRDDSNYPALAENLRRLRGSRDVSGRPIEVVELPMPPPVVFRGQRCPASYANFYLANDRILVPVFDAPSDRRALDIFRELLPERTVIPIPSRELVIGFGSIHCLSQQEPLVS